MTTLARPTPNPLNGARRRKRRLATQEVLQFHRRPPHLNHSGHMTCSPRKSMTTLYRARRRKRRLATCKAGETCLPHARLYLIGIRTPPPPITAARPVKRSAEGEIPSLTGNGPPPTCAAGDDGAPVSPPRPPLRELSHKCFIILDEGDPDRDALPKLGPFASLVPPSSTWNKFYLPLVGIHFPSGSAVSPC